MLRRNFSKLDCNAAYARFARVARETRVAFAKQRNKKQTAEGIYEARGDGGHRVRIDAKRRGKARRTQIMRCKRDRHRAPGHRTQRHAQRNERVCTRAICRC